LSSDVNTDFSFIPKGLLDKCRPFIVRYHQLNGFSSLPDILWHPETRQFIEADSALRQEFKRAASCRGAQKANEGFVSIAALILSTEILAIGLADWATRFPTAHKKARALFIEYAPSSRAHLTERYLFSQTDHRCTDLDILEVLLQRDKVAKPGALSNLPNAPEPIMSALHVRAPSTRIAIFPGRAANVPVRSSSSRF